MTHSTHTAVLIPDEAVQAMPERIYASAPSTNGCVVSFDIPSLAYDTEYIRADVASAHLSAPCAVDVDALANEIRRVNGSNNLGAGALAEALMPFLSCVVTKPVNIPALLQEVRSGERDGFINTGKEPHGNDADLSCPCCGGSGHKDDAKPVDVAAVREAAEKLIRNRFDTYTAKNGKRASIEGDDGEKCWIVSFEDMSDLEIAIRALYAAPKAEADK